MKGRTPEIMDGLVPITNKIKNPLIELIQEFYSNKFANGGGESNEQLF